MSDHEYEVYPALVLDLDGTIRRSKSGKEFISGPDDIEIIWDVVTIAETYKRQGFLILGASNQAGIAHDFKSYTDVLLEIDDTRDLINEQFEDQFFFDEIFIAPSDEKGKVFPYNYRSLLRKPNYGMLVEMELFYFKHRKIIIDWNNSFFVGDREEDKLCAANADIKFYHVNEFLENHGFPKI